jgi:hypothetical protein
MLFCKDYRTLVGNCTFYQLVYLGDDFGRQARRWFVQYKEACVVERRSGAGGKLPLASAGLSGLAEDRSAEIWEGGQNAVKSPRGIGLGQLTTDKHVLPQR